LGVIVRGDEHGDGRPTIRFDFVVVLCSGLIEARDHQEIGAFEKCGIEPDLLNHFQQLFMCCITVNFVLKNPDNDLFNHSWSDFLSPFGYHPKFHHLDLRKASSHSSAFLYHYSF